MKFTLLKRLTLGYVVILCLVVLLGVYVSLNLNLLNRLIRGTAIDGTTIARMEHLRDTLFSQVSFEKKYHISKDVDFKNKFLEIRELFRTGLDENEHRMDTPRKITLFKEIRELYDQYLESFEEENKRLYRGNSGNSKPSPDYVTQNETVLDGIALRLNGIIAIVQNGREEKILSAGSISARVFNMTLFTAILTVAVGTLISFFSTRRINRSIVLLQKKTKEIAEGNYVQIPSMKGPPEIENLADDFNVMSIRLKQLDEMKIDFINHLSHELRTPLTAIREASEMLLEGTYANAPEKKQQLLVITREECERLIRSVNRILDFSRMEAHMMEYRYQKSKLAPLLHQAVLKLMPIAQSKRIQLELKPPPGLPLIRMDAERISQVLDNLIGNALKFTPQDGQVRIMAAPYNHAKKFVCVAVSDTGIGIAAASLTTIFEKFSRVENNGHKTAGSGLGLTIAKHIISDHGGEIWAKSAPGSGSTFYFALPAA
ncbi:MAG: HAMP domain-containing sensor histidine kinase [Desulfobacterales bacterium]